MWKKILSGIIGCFVAAFAFAQAENEGNIRELIKIPMPPSPNASALGKFGEIPVGLSTGIPTITVPIFSWSDQLKELSFDVSLNYHAGGHKVEDMASNVGLGWALNAGGVVSRSVRGLPDDGTGGYLNTAALPNLLTIDAGHLSDPPTNPAHGLTLNNSANFYTARYINDRSLDGEYDIWNLNAGNISARFFIDKNGVINFFTQTNISVSYTRSPGGVQPITKFTMVDDRAITYLFDITEGTESIGQQTVPGQIGNGCTSSYYLSKIISADKQDTIFLSYSSPGHIYYEGGFSQSYRATLSTANGFYDPPDISWTFSTIHAYNSLRISGVNLPDGTQLSFAYNFSRADYYGDHALTEISISNAGFSKKFNLSYNYFTCDADPYAGSMSSVNDYSKRLKLLQVQEISGTDSLPPYIFEYNAQNLPPRNSKAQDHWGYFRGLAGGVNSLNPQITFQPGVLMPPPQLGDVSRYPVEQYTKAAVLEKITYPTGGFTRFTYHINDSQTDLYNISSTISTVTLDENQGNSYYSLSLPNRNKDTVLFKVQLFNYLPPPENEPWSEDCYIEITIKSTDNAVTRTISTYYAAALNGVLATVVLPLGKTYQVKYETGCTWMQDYDIGISYQFWFQPVAKNVGGLRVEKTEDNDSLGNKIFTEYIYKTYDNKSSGTLQNLPNYNYYKSATRIFLVDWKLHYNIASTPNQTLSFFRGSPVIYTRVKVNKSTPTTNVGYSIHEFTEFSQMGYADTYYPYIQTQDIDWAQGVALRDSIFNSSNVLVKSVRKEWQFYSFGGDSAKWRNVITGLIYNDGASTLSHYTYAAKSYVMQYGRAELKKETEVLYSLGDSIKTVTEYTYDPGKFLMTKKKTYNSLGEEIETRLYYPFNYSINTDERTSSVIAKEIFKKQGSTWYITSGFVNEFAQFNGSFLKQKKMIAAELVSPLTEATLGAFNQAQLVRHASFKEQVEFLSYDAKGRYTELKTMNKPVTAVIWCNTRNYPMAVVENASYANSAYTSFETVDVGNWSGIAIGNIQTAIAATGAKYYQQTGFSISKSGLTSSLYYIVSYWSKNGSYSIAGTQAGYPKTLRTVGSGGDTWTLYEHLVTSQTTITVTGTGSIDELRLYPRGSQMVTYTFKPLAGIGSQCDANNKIIHYEYDGFGRLLLVRDQDKNILKKIEYKYKYAIQ